jgi:hypothetical protein
MELVQGSDWVLLFAIAAADELETLAARLIANVAAPCSAFDEALRKGPLREASQPQVQARASGRSLLSTDARCDQSLDDRGFRRSGCPYRSLSAFKRIRD